MKQAPASSGGSGRLSEDWLVVIIGFVLILLAVLGLLGPAGLPIGF